MSVTSEENQILQQVYKRMRALELATARPFAAADLQAIESLLLSFSESENQELRKLSLIPAHLHPEMSMEHLSHFLIPIERWMGRGIREDQFLVTRDDRASNSLSKIPLHFVLENIRSSFNVGSIFRLADCLSIAEIYLCGYTPTPLQEGFEKTSLGTSKTVSWSQHTLMAKVLKDLRARQVRVIALETAQNSTSLFDCNFDQPTAFVVGNERYGLEASALSLCDQVVSIPTFGAKNSLNVSNALSIAGYFFRHQWDQKNLRAQGQLPK